MQFEEYKPTLDKLVDAAEESAVTAVKLSEQLNGINGRLTRVENALEILLRDIQNVDNPTHKSEVCPYSRKFDEYDRLLFGGPDSEGLMGRIGRMEK